MRRTIGAWLALVTIAAAASPVAAQTRGPDDTFERGRDAATELAEAFRAELTSYYDALEAARTAGRTLDRKDPTAEWVERALEASRPFAGKDGEIPFIAFAVQVTNDDAQRRDLVERGVRDHLESPALTPLVAAITWVVKRLDEDVRLAAIDRIIERNPYPEIRAEALLARARRVFAKYPIVENPTPAQRAAAVKDLRAAMELARGVGRDQIGRLPVAPPMDLRRRVAGQLFEATNLAIGDVAPEIEGTDLDGVPFKLTDYRGKVVMLDFWGDW